MHSGHALCRRAPETAIFLAPQNGLSARLKRVYNRPWLIGGDPRDVHFEKLPREQIPAAGKDQSRGPRRKLTLLWRTIPGEEIKGGDMEKKLADSLPASSLCMDRIPGLHGIATHWIPLHGIRLRVGKWEEQGEGNGGKGKMSWWETQGHLSASRLSCSVLREDINHPAIEHARRATSLCDYELNASSSAVGGRPRRCVCVRGEGDGCRGKGCIGVKAEELVSFLGYPNIANILWFVILY